MKRKLVVAMFFLCNAILHGQVTIGSGEKPNKGSLLDLKEWQNKKGEEGNANATKGIGLPRVKIEAINRLEPCVETTLENMQQHVGLTVYNLADTPPLKKGLYVWNGELWQPLNGEGEIGLGPWYDVETKKPASANDRAAYLIGQTVIGTDKPIDDAQLTVKGNTVIAGKTTIGGALAPEKAAILDLKSQEPDLQTGVTSTIGGMILPRVNLVDLHTLEPFIPLNDDSWSAANQANTKAYHKGMLVYHVGQNNISEGEYVWNGRQWGQKITVNDPNPIDGQFLAYDKSTNSAKWETVNIPTVNKGDYYQRWSSVAVDIKGISLPYKGYQDIAPYKENDLLLADRWIPFDHLRLRFEVSGQAMAYNNTSQNRLAIEFQTGLQTNIANGWISYAIGVFIKKIGESDRDFKLKLVRTAVINNPSNSIYPFDTFTLIGAIDDLAPGSYELVVAGRRRNQSGSSYDANLFVGRRYEVYDATGHIIEIANNATTFQLQSSLTATLYLQDK